MSVPSNQQVGHHWNLPLLHWVDWFTKLALRGQQKRWEGPKAVVYQPLVWRTGKGRFGASNAARPQVLPRVQSKVKKAMGSLFHDLKIILSDSIDSSIGSWKTKCLLLRNVYANGGGTGWSRMGLRSSIWKGGMTGGCLGNGLSSYSHEGKRFPTIDFDMEIL